MVRQSTAGVRRRTWLAFGFAVIAVPALLSSLGDSEVSVTMKQQSFLKAHWDHRFCHGGSLRRKRRGRGQRPLSTKDPLHVVFKIDIAKFPRGLRNPVTHTLINQLIRKYAKRFFVKVEQCSVQRDHIHLLIRCPKRSFFHHFFRVVAGQISQTVTDTQKLWGERPWSRVIKGYKSYLIARNYVRLNEKEARGEIPYSRRRLKGLTFEQIKSLWG